VWICTVHRQRLALPQRLVRPDLVVEREEALDLLGQRRRLIGLALVEVLVLERTVERSTMPSVSGAW
jgi:hypothetical protein